MLEASIVVEGRGGAEAGHELDAFLEHAAIEPAPVTAEHLEAARQAWRRFGKGRHPAALNFGDWPMPRPGHRRTVIVQGRRLLAHRYPGGLAALARDARHVTTGRPFQGSLFADTGAKQGANAFAEDWRRCEHGLAVVESKPAGFDRSTSAQDVLDGVPSSAVRERPVLQGAIRPLN